MIIVPASSSIILKDEETIIGFNLSSSNQGKVKHNHLIIQAAMLAEPKDSIISIDCDLGDFTAIVKLLSELSPGTRLDTFKDPDDGVEMAICLAEGNAFELLFEKSGKKSVKISINAHTLYVAVHSIVTLVLSHQPTDECFSGKKDTCHKAYPAVHRIREGI